MESDLLIYFTTIFDCFFCNDKRFGKMSFPKINISFPILRSKIMHKCKIHKHVYVKKKVVVNISTESRYSKFYKNIYMFSIDRDMLSQ